MSTPIVMMISVTGEARRAGWIVTRSSSPPTAVTATTARATARGRGRPSGPSETRTIAPSMANSPWAKLMIPVTL
jgi:hypothetical protein